MNPRRVRTDSQVAFRRLGDRMLLIHLRTNQIFDLNETSARFWELLNEVGDIDLAERRLQEEYAVEPARLHAEVTRIVDLLEAEKLIVLADRG
jgi:hypothetical protein